MTSDSLRQPSTTGVEPPPPSQKSASLFFLAAKEALIGYVVAASVMIPVRQLAEPDNHTTARRLCRTLIKIVVVTGGVAALDGPPAMDAEPFATRQNFVEMVCQRSRADVRLTFADVPRGCFRDVLTLLSRKEFSLTSKQAYQSLLDYVFGAGEVVADAPDDASNPITKAVRHNLTSGRFSFFARELENRLLRLKAAFANEPSKGEVIGKVRRLASERNYPGTLAELAAYDYLAALTTVEAEIKIPAAQTLASLLPNRLESSFDVCLLEISNVLADVKSFSDILSEVVGKIVARNMPLPGIYRIDASYPYDLPYESVTPLFSAIVEGLAASAAAHETSYRHPDVPDLRFRFITDPPPHITSTTHTYSPAKLLDEKRYFVLNHFDQLLREAPNLLIYVVHPWFNLVQCPFTRNADFYKEYCRRVFLDLAVDTTPMKDAVPHKAPGVTSTVAETVRKLGAIMFLEDLTVEPPEDYDETRPLNAVRAWLFVNRNADQVNDASNVCDHLANLAGQRRLRLNLDCP